MLDAAISPGPAPIALPFGGPGSPVRIESLGPRARFALRLRQDHGFARVEESFGLALPREACRFNKASDRRALWLGPDEWLLVAPYNQAGTLFAGIEAALEGIPHSLVEVSHRSLGFALTGPKAASVLASGCPLDLDLRAFPVGMATRTVLAKTEIILQRVGAEEFQIDVWRSFANYTLGYLIEAVRSHD
ncbi:sarcosine oxidase subunit gamma [Aureimonas ureilytica]|uniref:sarcosine oxidase subunit gamma n=1 Tax=Aureimonas ureilytica TaxID=401562 RepID=UPI000734EAC6|nr:sarcosine oxidase subunit gamma family protein [Aureimonas ureilytica]